MAYSDTLEYLYALKNRGSKFGIDRMRHFVEALGHPERSYPIIHVAGTNGKGSVCAMLEALYRKSGYKTGFFSSPHLVHLGERAQVNREILSEKGIVRFTEELRPIAEALGKDDPDLHPTFFEFIAAMAFLRFASEQVDIALIETGLGGRLDATNVVEPELSIITSISFDHMDLLGDTLAKIAVEKAGIIKPGKPVLIGCLPAEAEKAIRGVADERGSKLYSVRERFAANTLPETNLSGDFQRWNAGVAVFATEILADRFPGRATKTGDKNPSQRSRSASASVASIEPPGLSAEAQQAKEEGAWFPGRLFSTETAPLNRALMQVDWPGRWQTLELDGRTLILDATHNPEGAEALKENLRKLVETSGQKPIVVAGVLGEARGRSLMEAVAPFARELYLVAPSQERATPTAFLESCLPESHGIEVSHTELSKLFAVKNAEAHLGDARRPSKPSAWAPINAGESRASTLPSGGPVIGQAGDTIVVTGSIYLIGEVLERIQGNSHLRRGYGGHAGSGGDLQDKF